MRYIINDDDFEEWIEKLEDVLNGFENNDTLQYVIEEMKNELDQHKKKEDS